jgi:hypothetical protein
MFWSTDNGDEYSWEVRDADDGSKTQGRLRMRKQDMVDSLLELGVRRGMLTWQELNDAFPAESFSLDELERFLRLLEDLGVKVVDSVQMRREKISYAWRSRQEH